MTTTIVSAGQILSGFSIVSGSIPYVYGSAINATVSSGATEYVLSGGFDIGAMIYGLQLVSAGGAVGSAALAEQFR